MINMTKTNPVKRILPLLWVMFFDHTSLNITFPILTLLFFDTQSHLFPAGTSHAVRSMWYGLCVAVPHLMNIAITPILGSLSDEYGRRKILLVGTLGALLFALTAGFGIVYGMLSLLFLGRLIQGAFSRTNPIAQAVIGDISPPDKKVLYMGYLQTAIALGAFIGPLLGGYYANKYFFNELNFALPYFIAALFAGISCLITFCFFAETLIKPQTGPSSWRNLNWLAIKNVLVNPAVLKISLVLLLSQISWSLYYQFMPPILKTSLNFTAHYLGFFIGLIALWLALGSAVGIKILSYFCGLANILLIGLYLILIGLILTIVGCYFPGEHQLLIWLAAIPVAVGDIVVYSCLIALYSNVVAKDEQGKVMGISFTVIALIWSLTGLLGGLLMSLTILLPLIVAPLGIIIAIYCAKGLYSTV
jgi:MFS family permease